eukprot:15568006-Heterocapsa_arctica.AAC.1
MAGPAKRGADFLRMSDGLWAGRLRPGRAWPMRSLKDRLAGKDPWRYGVRAHVGLCGDSVGWGDA